MIIDDALKARGVERTGFDKLKQPGLVLGVVWSAMAARCSAVNAGEFFDDFNGYEVHLYQIMAEK